MLRLLCCYYLHFTRHSELLRTSLELGSIVGSFGRVFVKYSKKANNFQPPALGQLRANSIRRSKRAAREALIKIKLGRWA